MLDKNICMRWAEILWTVIASSSYLCKASEEEHVEHFPSREIRRSETHLCRSPFGCLSKSSAACPMVSLLQCRQILLARSESREDIPTLWDLLRRWPLIYQYWANCPALIPWNSLGGFSMSWSRIRWRQTWVYRSYTSLDWSIALLAVLDTFGANRQRWEIRLAWQWLQGHSRLH